MNHESGNKTAYAESGQLSVQTASDSLGLCSWRHFFRKTGIHTESYCGGNKHPDRVFYWQSKNPVCFEQYLPLFSTPNSILLTTLETNRNEGYGEVSKAPLPSIRHKAFRDLKWNRKIVTIEPILDFDEDVFYSWILEIQPEALWIGYNSHPNIRLPEPSLKKTMMFIKRMRNDGIEVREKLLRENI